MKEIFRNFVEQLPAFLFEFVASVIWAYLILTGINVIFNAGVSNSFDAYWYGGFILMFIREIADRAGTTYEVTEDSK